MTPPDGATRVSIDDVVVAFPTAHGAKVAVDHVSLQVEAGERVGIIGPNGAGKTTLLQVIAGLLRPTSGRVDVTGHVSAVMTLGVGLRQELSGRENIYTDGALSGRTRDEVDAVMDEIIAFTELGEFIDYPVRTYSTGMVSRLSFAMVTFVRPEILIVDEALSAGDAQFAGKATAKVREICAQGKILLVVSHSLDAIEAMCTRCIWLEGGKVRADGPPADVAAAYRQAVRAQEEERLLALFKKRPRGGESGGGVEIASLELVGPEGVARRVLGPDEPLSLRFVVRSARRLACPDLRLRIERLDGNVVMESWASREGCPPGPIEGEAEFEVPLGPTRLGHGSYELHLEVHEGEAPAATLVASLQEVLRIERRAGARDEPAYHAEVCWTFERLEG